MKVILRSDVEKVGRAGDVKDVSTGFGRNYLIPRRLAQEATPSAVRWWEKGREKRSKLLESKRHEARELAAKLSTVSLSFSRPAGAEGRIFGSVGKTDLLKSLKTCGYTIAKEAVVLEAAIKQTGEHEVELRLMPDVTAKIKISITARE